MSGRLVALRALGLGDALTAIPALRGIAAAFSGHRLQIAMPAWLEPLLGLAGLPFEVVPHTGLDPLPAGVAGADVAVNLHGRGPESHRTLLATGPRRLIAFASPEGGHAEGPRWRPGEHEVRRWCRMLSESGVPADRRRLRIAAPPAGRLARPGATVLHPGAASPARRWPWSRWAALAVREQAAGREVLVTGSPSEEPLARMVAEGAGLPESAVLAGRTDLLALAGVVAAAGRVVCGDTGVAHLATALGRPSVVLFGPISPDEWGPPRHDARHRVLWTGRRGDPHGDEPDPGLLEIALDDVAREVEAVA